jgi:Glycosyl hydrolases family 16
MVWSLHIASGRRRLLSARSDYMNRRSFIFYAASSASIVLPAMPRRAASRDATDLSASGDARGAVGAAPVIEDTFRGVELTMPNGSKKRYPDPATWAFTFWPGTKWPDSYGDGTNWLAGNAECQTYVTPFINKIKGATVPLKLRYDPFTVEPDGLHIKASLLSAEQQLAYQVGLYRRFGSGMLLSRKSFTFGNISMVAKLPSARGSWPDLWLLPESHQWPPEIDIFESMPWGKHQQQLHFGALVPKGAPGSVPGKWADLGTDLSAGFHQYDLNWTSETMTASFDGKVYWQQATPPSLKQNMYLIINFAVGGKWPFNELGVLPVDSISPDRLAAGADLIQADYPAEMIIKSIKVTPIRS